MLTCVRLAAGAAVVVGAMLCSAPITAAESTNPLCDESEGYRNSHPLICDTFERGGGGLPNLTPGDDGDNEGLIGKILGGLGLL